MKSTKKAFFVLLSCFVLAFSFLIPVFVNNKTYQAKADTGFNITSTAYRSSFLLLNCAMNTQQRSGNKNDFRVITAYLFVDVVDSVVDSVNNNLSFNIYFDWLNPVDNTNSRVQLSNFNRTYNRTTNFLSNDLTGIQSVSGYNNTFRGQYDFTTTTSSSSITTSEFGFYASTVNITNWPSYEFMLYRGNNFNFNKLSSLTYGHYAWNEVDSRFNLSTSYFSSHRNMASYWYYQFKYVDQDNNEFLFIIPAGREQAFERTSFFSNEDADSYNAGYNAGYSAGLDDNQQVIYDTGYSDGNTFGYGAGYSAGLNDANQYSFYNLFGAVLDAPVQTLIGLLNFNLLGVNLLSLFGGLLALALLLFVIKLLLGGK